MANEAAPSEPDTTTMVVNRTFAKRLKAIAEHHDITMSEALDRFAGQAILRECRKVLDAQVIELGEAGA